jgi:hypothetical protein
LLCLGDIGLEDEFGILNERVAKRGQQKLVQTASCCTEFPRVNRRIDFCGCGIEAVEDPFLG